MTLWQQLVGWLAISCLGIIAAGPLPAALAAETPAYLERQPDVFEAPGRGMAGTVRARPRPDFEADGLPLGSFRVLPSAVVETDYDSNVFRRDEDVRGDVVGRFRPAVKLRSDWSRHSLALSASADIGVYAVEESENYTDARAAAATVIEIQQGWQLEAGLNYAHLHEPRGSVDGGGGTEPVTFDRSTAQAALAGQSGRFFYRVGGGYTLEDYHDVPKIGGGTLDEDDRDQTIWSGFGMVSYEALPGTRAFVAGQYRWFNFEAARDDNGVDRDSHQQTVVAGVDVDLGGVTFARAYAGWMGQQFDDASLVDVSGFTAGGDLTANVTPLTTVTAAIGQDLHSTVTAGASAFLETRGRLSVDHELLRNLLLDASVWVRRLSFDGIDRTDDHFGFGLGGDYLVNRYVRLRLQYDFDLLNSHGSDATSDWRRHVVALSLVLQR